MAIKRFISASGDSGSGAFYPTKPLSAQKSSAAEISNGKAHGEPDEAERGIPPISRTSSGSATHPFRRLLRCDSPTDSWHSSANVDTGAASHGGPAS